MSNGWKGGSTTAWRKTRAAVLARNVAEHGGRCQLALPGRWRTTRGQWVQCLGVADTVHHTAGRARTGDDPRYLLAVCSVCNLKVGDPTRGDPAPRPLTQW